MAKSTTGYVLAGGRSRRMGQNKADLVLGKKTLLEWAVRKLARVSSEIVVVGPEGMLDGVRSIVDRHVGCGPLGGMEVALDDIAGEWAAFLPVDMPMLPDGLLEALHAEWSEIGARAGFAVTQGQAQPLISRLHRQALDGVRQSLEQGALKVRPVLEAMQAAATDVCWQEERQVVRVGAERLWVPSEAEWAMRSLWFSNLNTPEEFQSAQRFAGLLV